MEMFLVGGAVRDLVMGRESKDWDFTCVLDETETNSWPFGTMQAILEAQGFEIFLASPEHFTVRARAPRGWTFAGKVPPVNTFDFVLARRDVKSVNGRQAIVEPGTLADDLARRDFTINAIAMDNNGAFIDPHNGVSDIGRKILRTVGFPKFRFREDGLRVLRAIRFAITLGFTFDDMLLLELQMRGMHHLRTGDVSIERTREELHKCFTASTVRTVRMLQGFDMFDELFDGTEDLWLMPTTKPR